MSTETRQVDPFSPALRITNPGLHSWLIEPAGVINQVLAVRITVEVTKAITVDVDRKMKARFPGRHDYLYIHDFTHAIGYDTDARKMLIEWGRASKEIVGQIMVVISPTSNPLFRMGAFASVAALRVLKIPIDCTDSLQDVLRQHNVIPVR
jgi:hypothetical protein